MYMIPHRAGDADAPRRTFGLKPRGHVHRVAMQVCTVGNRVTDVNPEPKTDGPVRRLIAIMDVNLLLYLHSTTHRPIDAVEDDEQGVTAGLNDSAAVLLYCGVYQVTAQRPQPLQGSHVVQANETAVTDHIGVDDRDQLAPILRASGRVGCAAPSHNR